MLASEYRRTTGKPLAGISVEISEYDATNLLDLVQCEPRVAGYDAIGKGKREGKRIQIKGRVLPGDMKVSGQRIGQLKLDQEWDSVVLVLLDENYQPIEIYEAERDVILENTQNKPNEKRNKRGAMSIARFMNISRLAWSRENGVIEPEVWDNKVGV